MLFLVDLCCFVPWLEICLFCVFCLSPKLPNPLPGSLSECSVGFSLSACLVISCLLHVAVPRPVCLSFTQFFLLYILLTMYAYVSVFLGIFGVFLLPFYLYVCFICLFSSSSLSLSHPRFNDLSVFITSVYLLSLLKPISESFCISSVVCSSECVWVCDGLCVFTFPRL